MKNNKDRCLSEEGVGLARKILLMGVKQRS